MVTDWRGNEDELETCESISAGDECECIDFRPLTTDDLEGVEDTLAGEDRVRFGLMGIIRAGLRGALRDRLGAISTLPLDVCTLLVGGYMNGGQILAFKSIIHTSTSLAGSHSSVPYPSESEDKLLILSYNS